MSYRKKHIKSKIHRIRPQKSILSRPWFWFLVLFLALVIIGAYFTIFDQKFQLKDIIISGNNKVKTDEIKELVSNHANTGLVDFGSIKIISRSIFLIDEKKINEDILRKFPVIEKLTINKNFPQTLLVGVTERKPLGAYCDKQNNCYLIDQNGVIFEPLGQKLPMNTTIVRQIIEEEQILTGEKAVEQKIIDIIFKIQKNLQDSFQINLKEALVTSPVRLNAATDKNWKIYFDLGPDADINLQLTKLDLLLDGGMSKSEMENLRYIDLRPKGKAIICDNSVCGAQ